MRFLASHEKCGLGFGLWVREPPTRVHQIPHHLAHAASAYLTSGWLESLVVVIDAMGEAQNVTIYRAHEQGLKRLKEISGSDSIVFV